MPRVVGRVLRRNSSSEVAPAVVAEPVVVPVIVWPLSIPAPPLEASVAVAFVSLGSASGLTCASTEVPATATAHKAAKTRSASVRNMLQALRSGGADSIPHRPRLVTGLLYWLWSVGRRLTDARSDITPAERVMVSSSASAA